MEKENIKAQSAEVAGSKGELKWANKSGRQSTEWQHEK